jgi:hypothetical protein
VTILLYATIPKTVQGKQKNKETLPRADVRSYNPRSQIKNHGDSKTVGESSLDIGGGGGGGEMPVIEIARRDGGGLGGAAAGTSLEGDRGNSLNADAIIGCDGGGGGGERADRRDLGVVGVVFKRTV